MKHPTPEQWMALLYGETAEPGTLEFETHLRECETCRNQFAQWREAKGHLNEWQLEQAPAATSWRGSKAAWGIAAAITLLFGVGLGRLTAARSNDPEQVAKILEPRIQARIEAAGREQELRVQERLKTEVERRIAEASALQRLETGQLLARLDGTNAIARRQDKEELVNLVKQLENDNLTRWASLRKDLETVAIVAEVRMRTAQFEIGQIASTSQHNSSVNSDSQ